MSCVGKAVLDMQAGNIKSDLNRAYRLETEDENLVS